MNDKPKVSEETRRAIQEYAQKMEYKPNKLAQSLARNPKIIGFITPAYPDDFMRYVAEGINRAVNDLIDYNVQGMVRTSNNVKESMKAAKEMIAKKVDGIILLSNQIVPGIKELLKEQEIKDIPVAAIVSEPTDGTPLIGMVKSDGHVLGRMAAQFLSLCMDKSKKVAIFIPQEDAIIHRECSESFEKSSLEFGMNKPLLFNTSLEGVKAESEITRRIIESQSDIGGIYVASNNSVGVCLCLEEMGRTDIKVIGHDLYPALAECIERGSLHATLFQNQYLQAQKAVDLMFLHITENRKPFGVKNIRPELVMLSNLSCYKNMY